MGYDMTHRNIPEAVREAAQIAGAKFWDAVNHRDTFERGSDEHTAAQVAVESASDERDKADSGDFRLNIWAMGRYRDIMTTFGMIHDSSNSDVPEWPDYPEDDSDEESPAMKEYEAAALIVQGYHHEADDPTIPVHKFCSNDGWWVTSSEAAAAVEVWDKRDPALAFTEVQAETLASDYWGEWITYLRNAIDRDGFQVY